MANDRLSVHSPSENKPEAFIQSYRALAITITRQPLEVKGFDGVQVNLRFRIGEDLNLL